MMPRPRIDVQTTAPPPFPLPTVSAVELAGFHRLKRL
jgi:hypothetical protein